MRIYQKDFVLASYKLIQSLSIIVYWVIYRNLFSTSYFLNIKWEWEHCIQMQQNNMFLGSWSFFNRMH